MTRDAIGSEIKTACKGRENVPKKTRSKSGSVYYGSILSLKEVVIFIANNDAPAGYVLDEEMQRRVDEYKRVCAIVENASWIKEKK